MLFSVRVNEPQIWNNSEACQLCKKVETETPYVSHLAERTPMAVPRTHATGNLTDITRAD